MVKTPNSGRSANPQTSPSVANKESYETRKVKSTKAMKKAFYKTSYDYERYYE